MGNGECLEGVLNCLEGVWICRDGVCNVLERVLKMSDGSDVWCPPLPVIFSPHLNRSLHQKSMCGVHPSQHMFLLCGVLPPCSSVHLPHLALSWILSEDENLASSNLQDEATDWLFW